MLRAPRKHLRLKSARIRDVIVTAIASLAAAEVRPQTTPEPPGSVRYFHYDGLGTPSALTDADGNVAAHYRFDAWGLCARTMPANA